MITAGESKYRRVSGYPAIDKAGFGTTCENSPASDNDEIVQKWSSNLNFKLGAHCTTPAVSVKLNDEGVTHISVKLVQLEKWLGDAAT